MLNPAHHRRPEAVRTTRTRRTVAIRSALLTATIAVGAGAAANTVTSPPATSPQSSPEATLTFPPSWARPGPVSADELSPWPRSSAPAAATRPAATASTGPVLAMAAPLAAQPAGPAHAVRPRLSPQTANNAIWYARRQLGRPYQWGGTGNVGFDCSGLVMMAYQFAGVYLPRTTYQQAKVGVRISRWELQPGDLVFSNSFGHVQMYIGGGQIIEAARPGTVVRIGWLPSADRVDAYVQVPG
ncbi:C40 family peptidase [Planosporangium sp. 12N6]|uniref:C40 family peptidase n=1 Tax=Planosporangium spinosum TaxID=3402278 RepID=UPI003CF6C124